MILVTMYRLYKLVLYFGAPLVFYARLAWSKVWPERPPMRRLQMQSGQGLVEYALVLVLVAVVIIAILTVLGPQIGAVFFKVQCGLASGEIAEQIIDGRAGLRCEKGGVVIGDFFTDNGEVNWDGQ